MDKKVTLVAIASGILASSTAKELLAVPKKGAVSVECFGIHACKGKNACAIDPKQIDAANKKFSGKFAKSKPIDCSGYADGSAKDGFLAWQSEPSVEECFKKGGFVFERKGNEFLVKEKS